MSKSAPKQRSILDYFGKKPKTLDNNQSDQSFDTGSFTSVKSFDKTAKRKFNQSGVITLDGDDGDDGDDGGDNNSIKEKSDTKKNKPESKVENQELIKSSSSSSNNNLLSSKFINLLNKPYEFNDNYDYMDICKFMQIDFTVNDNGNENNENESEKSDYGLFIYKNFRLLMDNVLRDEMNKHLFNDEDWKIIESFTSLNGLGQMLFIRLFLRKQDWVRTKSIKYSEITENLPSIINELVEKGFLKKISELNDLNEAMETLELNDLKTLCRLIKGINMPSPATKPRLIESVLHYIKTSRPLNINKSNDHTESDARKVSEDIVLKTIKSILKDSCVKINQKMVFERIFLLLSPPELNEEDVNVSLSSEIFKLLKIETGQILYQDYNINKSTIIYEKRDDLIRFSESCKLEYDILTCVEKKNYSKIVECFLNKAKEGWEDLLKCNTSDFKLPTFLRRHTGGFVYIRCLNHCVDALEKQRNYSQANSLLKNVLLAQSLYCQDYRGRWYERYVLNSEKHLKNLESALDMAEQALDDPNVRVARHLSLYIRRKNLQKLLKKRVQLLPNYEQLTNLPSVTIEASTVKYEINGRVNIFKTTDSNGDVTVLSVENIAIEHYKKNGFSDGVHSEGKIYHAIFCLLFWDIIYLDCSLLVPDSFRFLYQRLPLDFNTEQFYYRRQSLIDFKLEEIRNCSKEELNTMLEMSWNSNVNKFSLINWEGLTLDKVQTLASLFGPQIVCGICERLIKDFRFTRSGFPDLIVWNDESKNIRAVEVKGPKDKLSSKQILWLSYLQSLGLSVEICHVKAKKFI